MKFHHTKFEDIKSLSADLVHRGKQLLRRQCAPHKLSEGAEYMLVKGWIDANGSKRLKLP